MNKYAVVRPTLAFVNELLCREERAGRYGVAVEVSQKALEAIAEETDSMPAATFWDMPLILTPHPGFRIRIRAKAL